MPFKLLESVDDFNVKYRDAIGVLDAKNYRNEPIYFNSVTENTLIYYFINKNSMQWEASEIRLTSIDSLRFTFPYFGQVWRRGYAPVYVDRAMVRNVNRGWSSLSVNVRRNVFLEPRILGTKVNCFSTRANSAILVSTIFNHEYEFVSLSELINEDLFTAALSSSFAVIKCGNNKWLLLYRQHAIGHLAFDDEGAYEILTTKSLAGLNDVFFQQVKE